MKTRRRILCFLLAISFSCASIHAAVSVTFDEADSNIGAGLYDFTLTGAPGTATLANFNSAFTITGWAAPAIGNNVTLASTLAPSAWNLTQNDSNNARWILESTTSPNNLVDGRFEVHGKANLHGTLTWQLAWPGDSTYTSSGLVTLSAVPEPATYGMSAASALVGVVLLARIKRQ